MLKKPSFPQIFPFLTVCLPFTKTKQLILADQSRVAIKAETSAITIRLGHLECKIKGIVFPYLNVDKIVVLSWLRQSKPTIDWESSVLTVLRNGVN